MKKLLFNLIFILYSVFLFGQNENPFTQFGYEAPIMDDDKGVDNEIRRLIIINTDTIATNIGWLEIDVVNKNISYFSRAGERLFQDSLPTTILLRWLTTDPANQFYSPYLGMGNNPISGIDPDGREWYTHVLTGNEKWFSPGEEPFYYSMNGQNGMYLDKTGEYGHNGQFINLVPEVSRRASPYIIDANGGMRIAHWFRPANGALEPSFVGDLIAFAPLGVLKASLSANVEKSSASLVDDLASSIKKGDKLELKSGQEINYVLQDEAYKLHFRVETHGKLSNFVGHNDPVRHANVQLYKNFENRWIDITNTLPNNGHIILDPN